MAGYSNNFNDELRARLSIVDIVGKRVPLIKKGQNFWGCCPFHNEKTPSFSVNEQKGFYHCFGCGEHGDIISFLMKSQNMQYIDAIRELANMAGLKMPDYKPKTPEQTAREQTYVEIMTGAARAYAAALFSPAGASALEYIKKRGFSIDVIKRYGLGYAPGANVIASKFSNQKLVNLLSTGLVRESTRGGSPYDFFRDRLMFPIFNPNGQVIAFSGRSLDGSEPKYINTTDTELFHKRRTVFGLNFARDAIYKANRSIVVEGQIDVIQMQTHGFPETVAPLGTALTEEHLQILCKSNRNITFCFDGDTAGQKAAARALDIIAPLIRDTSDIRFAFMPAGSDPDDILRRANGTAAMKKIIDDSLPLMGEDGFLWKFLNSNFNTRTPNGKVLAEKWADKWLEKITDLKLREMFKTEINNMMWICWKKIKSKKDMESDAARKIVVPHVDARTQKTLSEIAAACPELIEKHAEFLAKTGMNFNDSPIANNQVPMTSADAEKFIVSLKLKNYLENLTRDKKELMSKMLNSAESADGTISEKIKFIDSEIKNTMDKIQKIAEI